MKYWSHQVRTCFTQVYALALLILISGIILPNSQLKASSGDPTNLKFQHIYEGLASGRITDIYQDRYDYMWIGTNSGLHLYNGIDFKYYSSNSYSTSIISNYIGRIFEDSGGNLWIGTAGGINKYNRETDNFERIWFDGGYHYNPETSSSVNSIIEDWQGTIWVAGGDEELYRLDEGKNQLEPFGGFKGIGINFIYEASEGELWLATTTEGLLKLDTSTGKIIEHYRHNPDDAGPLPTNSIESIIKDRHGNLWLGTLGEGLIRKERNGTKVSFYQYRHEPGNPLSLGNDYIFTLNLDNDRNLWVGNENGGLHLYNEADDNFHRYYNNPHDQHSITDDSIWVVFQDRNGRYWVGTGQTGLNVADRFNHKFTHFNQPMLRGGLKSYVIRDVLEGKNGDIWLATDGGGLSRFCRNTEMFTTYTHDPENPYSIASDAVIHLNKDEQGRIWSGTFRGGVNILTDPDEGRFTNFREWIGNDDYPMENVFAIHFDQQHDYIWIAALGEGLYRYNKKTEELIVLGSADENPAQTPSAFTISIFEDSNHNLWFATLEGLLLIPEESKLVGDFRHYSHNNVYEISLPSNIIQQVAEDSNQNIWVATSEGLSRFDPELETFTTYRAIDGLPSNDIRSLAADDKGNLWIGTNRGLSFFNTESETFKNYNSNDGLQGDEFSRYSVRKLSSEEFIFGGMNGFNIFHPDNVLENPYEPAVYITDFKLLNRPVEIGGENSPLRKHISMTDTLRLSHSQNIFTFEFIGLNYTQAEFNQYAYKLEGLENEWNYVGAQRNATYTNLSPGEYTFRVKAANNDGVWNEEGTSVAILISPPFWQTYWFYLLTALLIAGVIGLGFRYRVRKIRQINYRLEREITRRTLDLKKALTELKETRDELIGKAHKAGMAEIASGVLHNVGNVLTSVNTSSMLIKETVNNSKLDGLTNANKILREHIGQIDQFISENPKGKKLMHYYLQLEKPLKEERKKIALQAERLQNKINLINEIIAAQQSYAGGSTHTDHVSLTEVVENALTLQAGSIERHSLSVTKKLTAADTVVAQRARLIHILVNLIKNAKEAMESNHPENKNLEIKTWQDSGQIYLSVSDNGAGIIKSNLNKIFSHAFTTKKNGHGFGLHSSAIYVNEMGGKMKVQSEGPGKGATFTLSFPAVPAAKKIK